MREIAWLGALIGVFLGLLDRCFKRRDVSQIQQGIDFALRVIIRVKHGADSFHVSVEVAINRSIGFLVCVVFANETSCTHNSYLLVSLRIVAEPPQKEPFNVMLGTGWITSASKV